jgi:hypothetical protein
MNPPPASMSFLHALEQISRRWFSVFGHVPPNAPFVQSTEGRHRSPSS